MKHKVDGHEGIYKDPDTGVIVSRASNDRNRYRIAKRQALANINSEHEINRLSKEIDEIKSLIKQLLDK